MRKPTTSTAVVSGPAGAAPEPAAGLRARTVKERVEALDGLQRKQLAGLEAAVLACLTHRSPVVRAAAADCLGRLEWREGAAALLPLLGDPAPEVRCSAAESTGTLLEGTGDCPAELRALLEDEDEFCRLIAVESMGLIGDRKMLDALWMKIDDREPLVRRNIAAVIGEMGRKADRGRLRRLLREETNQVARAGILEGLYELGETAVLPEMLALLGSPDYVVQCFVANALAEIDLEEAGARAAQKALREALRRDPSAAAREAFETALKSLRRRFSKRGNAPNPPAG